MKMKAKRLFIIIRREFEIIGLQSEKLSINSKYQVVTKCIFRHCAYNVLWHTSITRSMEKPIVYFLNKSRLQSTSRVLL